VDSVAAVMADIFLEILEQSEEQTPEVAVVVAVRAANLDLQVVLVL
jgi:hypothetical protein